MTTIEKIEKLVEEYRQNCKIEGVCIDKRLCCTCFYGGAMELIDEILDIIREGESNEYS